MSTATELANRLLVPSSGKKTLNADGTYSNVDPSVNYDRSSMPTVQGGGTFQSYDNTMARDSASAANPSVDPVTGRGSVTPTNPYTGAPVTDSRVGTATTTTPTVDPVTGAPMGEQKGSGNTDADFAYKQKVTDLFRDQSQLDSDAKLDADRTKSNLTTTLQAAKDNYIKSLESSKEHFGDTGTLRSGIFLKKQGEISTDYAKDAQGQLTNVQQHLEDLARETATRKQNIELQRQAAEKAQADARTQADLQRSLVEAQNKAYADFKAGLLGNTPSNGASTGGAASNGGQVPMGSGGQIGTAFAKDPNTGGTLFDGNGTPVTDARMAQQIIDQRAAENTGRSRQPGDGLVWDSNAGGYVNDPTWGG